MGKKENVLFILLIWRPLSYYYKKETNYIFKYHQIIIKNKELIFRIMLMLVWQYKSFIHWLPRPARPESLMKQCPGLGQVIMNSSTFRLQKRRLLHNWKYGYIADLRKNEKMVKLDLFLISKIASNSEEIRYTRPK